MKTSISIATVAVIIIAPLANAVEPAIEPEGFVTAKLTEGSNTINVSIAKGGPYFQREKLNMIRLFINKETNNAEPVDESWYTVIPAYQEPDGSISDLVINLKNGGLDTGLGTKYSIKIPIEAIATTPGGLTIEVITTPKPTNNLESQKEFMDKDWAKPFKYEVKAAVVDSLIGENGETRWGAATKNYLSGTVHSWEHFKISLGGDAVFGSKTSAKGVPLNADIGIDLRFRKYCEPLDTDSMYYVKPACELNQDGTIIDSGLKLGAYFSNFPFKLGLFDLSRRWLYFHSPDRKKAIAVSPPYLTIEYSWLPNIRNVIPTALSTIHKPDHRGVAHFVWKFPAISRFEIGTDNEIGATFPSGSWFHSFDERVTFYFPDETVPKKPKESSKDKPGGNKKGTSKGIYVGYQEGKKPPDYAETKGIAFGFTFNDTNE
jgi:hypothetical protein